MIARFRSIAIPATVEQLIVVTSLFWALCANHAFFSALGDAPPWRFVAAMLVVLVAVHILLLGAVATRWTIKPVLAVLLVAGATASYFIGAYGAYLDPSMLRNVLRTDFAEARELLAGRFWFHLALFAGVPLLLLTRVHVVARPWWRALAARSALLVIGLAALAGALLSVYQPFVSLMRNQRELRYLVTPANVVWSAASVAVIEGRTEIKAREPIGRDATPGPSWVARARPLVLVLVVGETARAANWGLDGYARQTTPELARLQPVNFANVTACGTSTQVSLPCMFAPVGRRRYDAARIDGQESLLHVLARAGVAVHWRDNQSGCKGVCDGLPNDAVVTLEMPGLCSTDRCQDAGLIADLDARLDAARGTQVWVLHMLGNHGPSYYRRYPREFARFQPDCRSDDLQRCSTAEIVNAYDNALLYTDHVLASAITRLRAHAGDVDSALLYVSDHGESLGERGLYLHGVPYAIAPQEQTHVPMIFWASDGFERGAGLAAGCLLPEMQRAAQTPVAHDHLFHTVLGLLDVRTRLYEPRFDLVGACRLDPSS